MDRSVIDFENGAVPSVNSTGESIYGGHLDTMNEIMSEIMAEIEDVRRSMTEVHGHDPVDHCLARIKSDESMREKCRARGIPETTDSALRRIHDAIGIRVVCGFLNDLYSIREAKGHIDGLHDGIVGDIIIRQTGRIYDDWNEYGHELNINDLVDHQYK